MPKVPTFNASGGPRGEALISAQVASAPARAAADELRGVSAQLFGEREREIKRRQRLELNENDRRVTETLNRLNLEYANRNDFKVFRQEHDARAGQEIDAILAGIEDDDVRAAVAAQANRSLAAQSRQIGRRAADLERGATISELDAALDADAAAFGLAPDAEAKRVAMDKALGRIRLAASTGDLSAEEAQSRDQAWRRTAGEAHARNLILRNPQEALLQLRDPEDPLLKGLAPDTREILASGAEAQIRARETERRRRLAEAEDAAMSEVVERIFLGDDHDKGAIDVVELMSNRMIPARAKITLANLIIDKATGIDDYPTDYRKLNDFWQRIGTGDLTDPGEVWANTGEGGIPIEQARAMEQRMLAGPRMTPNERLVEDTLNDLFRANKPAITRTELGLTTPKGDQQFFNWQIHVRERVRQEQAAGRNPMQTLLNPNSRDFIVNEMDPFRLTRDDFLEALELQAGGELVPVIEQVPNVPPRRDREQTPEEWERENPPSEPAPPPEPERPEPQERAITLGSALDVGDESMRTAAERLKKSIRDAILVAERNATRNIAGLGEEVESVLGQIGGREEEPAVAAAQ